MSYDIIILEDLRFNYRQSHIDLFIRLWNKGLHIKNIAKALHIKPQDVCLLIMHCEMGGMIKGREGGLNGVTGD